MNSEPPASWTNTVSKAAWTLLLVAVAAFVAWQLLQHFIVALVVVAALLGIYRFMLRGHL
jgi:hypothetical protein